MRRILRNVLRVASAPVGVEVGLWTASLWVDTSNLACGHLLMCGPGPRRLSRFGRGSAVQTQSKSTRARPERAVRIAAAGAEPESRPANGCALSAKRCPSVLGML
jgi:hypothetical protein